jgi:hypothetical protein
MGSRGSGYSSNFLKTLFTIRIQLLLRLKRREISADPKHLYLARPRILLLKYGGFLERIF